jgi:Staphylococcal nuclease homologue
MGRTLAFTVLCWPLALVAGERCLAIDGDTLVCNHQKVRLTNVYAAELNQAGGYAAKRRLQLIVSSGEVVLRPYGQDRYGRTLAEIYVNGRRIEQGDIGPRAGRGTQWYGDRHHYLPRHSKRPMARPGGPQSCHAEKDSGRFG